MNFKNEVLNLKNKCEEFLNTVKKIGNECAYTDRILEEVLATSDKLKEKYESF